MRNQTGTNNATLGIVCGGSNDNGSTIRNDIQKFTIDISVVSLKNYLSLAVFTAASGNASWGLGLKAYRQEGTGAYFTYGLNINGSDSGMLGVTHTVGSSEPIIHRTHMVGHR